MVIFPILQGGGFSRGDTIARRLGGLKLESELFRLLLIWRLYRVVASLRRPTEHFQWTMHPLQYNPDYAGCFNTTLSCLPLNCWLSQVHLQRRNGGDLRGPEDFKGLEIHIS